MSSYVKGLLRLQSQYYAFGCCGVVSNPIRRILPTSDSAYDVDLLFQHCFIEFIFELLQKQLKQRNLLNKKYIFFKVMLC